MTHDEKLIWLLKNGYHISIKASKPPGQIYCCIYNLDGPYVTWADKLSTAINRLYKMIMEKK